MITSLPLLAVKTARAPRRKDQDKRHVAVRCFQRSMTKSTSMPPNLSLCSHRPLALLSVSAQGIICKYGLPRQQSVSAHLLPLLLHCIDTGLPVYPLATLSLSVKSSTRLTQDPFTSDCLALVCTWVSLHFPSTASYDCCISKFRNLG